MDTPTKTITLSGKTYDPSKQPEPPKEAVTYTEAVEQITAYVSLHRGGLDMFAYSTVLAIIYQKTKEQTLDDLFEASK
jgi:hypothetical protein